MPSALPRSRPASSRCGPTGTAGRVTNSSRQRLVASIEPRSSSGDKVFGTTVLDATATGSYGVTKVDFLLTDGSHRGTLIASGTPTFSGWIAKWNSTPTWRTARTRCRASPTTRPCQETQLRASRSWSRIENRRAGGRSRESCCGSVGMRAPLRAPLAIWPSVSIDPSRRHRGRADAHTLRARRLRPSAWHSVVAQEGVDVAAADASELGTTTSGPVRHPQFKGTCLSEFLWLDWDGPGKHPSRHCATAEPWVRMWRNPPPWQTSSINTWNFS